MPQLLETVDHLRLQRLLEISTKLTSTLDLKQLIDLVTDAATDLTSTESASIVLVDRTTGQLYFAATTGTEAKSEAPESLDATMAGWVVRNGRPLLLDDVQEAGGEFAGISASGQVAMRDMLAVPLITNDRVTGALEVTNKRQQANYSQQDVALLQILASQVAVAIENARLFQQTDLLAEFMHELKTPLMALTAASELLARENLLPRQLELTEMIQRETMRLSRMAQDFLDLARLESGLEHIEHEPVDLSVLVLDVVGVQQSQAAERGITIQTQLSDRMPAVVGDYDRLKQVLLNLTSNAIKYNVEGGQVLINARSKEDEAIVEISDNGRGIAPENLPHLFERFYRIPDREGFTKGTGLGLSIAATIIQEHGGRIEVNSELGRGSTFRCFLPVLL